MKPKNKDHIKNSFKKASIILLRLFEGRKI